MSHDERPRVSSRDAHKSLKDLEPVLGYELGLSHPIPKKSRGPGRANKLRELKNAKEVGR